MVAAGPASADREDDEEEEKDPRPPAEEVTDLMETALGMYPTNVKGGIDAELKKLIMEKACQCAQTGRRTSTCTGFCKQLNLPRTPNC